MISENNKSHLILIVALLCLTTLNYQNLLKFKVIIMLNMKKAICHFLSLMKNLNYEWFGKNIKTLLDLRNILLLDIGQF